MAVQVLPFNPPAVQAPVFVRLSYAAHHIAGCSTATLRKMADRQEIECKRLPKGERRVNALDVARTFGSNWEQELNETPENATTDPTDGDKMVVGYCRCSSDKGSNSLDHQIEHIKEYIEQNFPGQKSKILAEYRSGICLERPKLLALLDLVLAGKVSIVVIQERTRLARMAATLIFTLFQKCGVTVVETMPQLSEEKDAIQEFFLDCQSLMLVFSSKMNGQKSSIKKRFIPMDGFDNFVAGLASQGLSRRKMLAIILADGRFHCANTQRPISDATLKITLKRLAKVNGVSVPIPEVVQSFIKERGKLDPARKTLTREIWGAFSQFAEQKGISITFNRKSFVQYLLRLISNSRTEKTTLDKHPVAFWGLTLKVER